jgi:hypothetical protein
LGIDFGSIYRKDKGSSENSFTRDYTKSFRLRQLKKKLKKNSKARNSPSNTGYAVDILLKSDLFSGTEPTINVGKLLCGSEGYFGIYHRGYLKVDILPNQ